MRHRNQLPIKSNQLFCNPGDSKFYLDIAQDGKVNELKLKFAFKLVFPEIKDKNSVDSIGKMCIELANDMSKYVLNDFRFIEPEIDLIMKNILRDVYVD